MPSLSSVCSLKEKVDSQEAAVLFLGLYLIAISTGGLLPAGSTLGADQFDEQDPTERKHMSSYFNWLLFSVVLGAIVGVTFLVWLEIPKKNYFSGYLISAADILLGMICIIMGMKTYRYKVLGDSPLLRIAQVFVKAFANRKYSLPEKAEELYELHSKESIKLQRESLSHTDSLRFLDKAAIVRWDSKSGDPCTVTQVEETKILVRMLPIFACTIIMSTCLAQLQTVSVEQGFAMNRKLGKLEIPPSSLPIIPLVFMLIITPVYDRLFVPFARRLTGHETGITYLQRVGVGLVLSIISMSIAAVVETQRKQHHKMSIFYLSFQYFVFGIADMFTLVGLLDFFYAQSPAGMKSLSTCFTWVSLSLGYFLSSVLVKIVNAATKDNTKSRGWVRGFDIDKTHVEFFYALLAILSTMNFCVYLLCAKVYQYRPPAKDQNQEDTFVGKRIDTPYHKSSSQFTSGTPQGSYEVEYLGQQKSNEILSSSPQQSFEFENSTAQYSSEVTTPEKIKMDSVSQEKIDSKNEL